MTSITKEKKTEIHVFGKINKEKINHFTPPYSVRNDCQIGQWKLGEDELLGNSLEICIIGLRHFFGDLGKTKSAQWVQVWFVGSPEETRIPRNTVCVSYVKTRSLAQLGQKAIQIMEKEDPAVGIFSAGFQKHQGDYGNYYSIKWEWRERKEEEMSQLKLIGDFLATNPRLIDPQIPPTMIELSSDGDEANPIEIEEARKMIKEILSQKADNNK